MRPFPLHTLPIGQADLLAHAGLPRVIADSLPAHLAPEVEREEGEEKEGEWRLFGEYLQAGARINVNVRAVF